MNTEGMEEEEVPREDFGQYNNTGALWRNSHQRKDNDPNSQGQAVIDGAHYRLHGWTRQQKNGAKYIRILFKKLPNAKAPQPKRSAG